MRRSPRERTGARPRERANNQYAAANVTQESLASPAESAAQYGRSFPAPRIEAAPNSSEHSAPTLRPHNLCPPTRRDPGSHRCSTRTVQRRRRQREHPRQMPDTQTHQPVRRPEVNFLRRQLRARKMCQQTDRSLRLTARPPVRFMLVEERAGSLREQMQPYPVQSHSMCARPTSSASRLTRARRDAGQRCSVRHAVRPRSPNGPGWTIANRPRVPYRPGRPRGTCCATIPRSPRRAPRRASHRERDRRQNRRQEHRRSFGRASRRTARCPTNLTQIPSRSLRIAGANGPHEIALHDEPRRAAMQVRTSARNDQRRSA
jgi:hypothetical protein